MTAHEPEKFSEKEKIQIILEEYRTLRSDIVQKTTVINQIYAVAGTVFVTAIGLTVAYGPTGWFAVVTGASMSGVIVLLVAGASILIHHDMRAISSRIQHIEADINRRAGGEKLLMWETICSHEAIFFRRKVKT